MIHEKINTLFVSSSGGTDEKRSIPPFNRTQHPQSNKLHEKNSINQSPFLVKLQHHLSGRQLLAEEIPFPIEEIQQHIKAGFIEAVSGITYTDNHYRCHRCGNEEQRLLCQYPCYHCQKQCTYCRKCIIMGKITECKKLYRWIGPPPRFRYEHALQWEGTLSPSQAKASEKIVSAIHERSELLVWAVCGAGKTEMLFAGLNEALRLGKRTAIATPRTDVVLELFPRIKQIFPEVPVTALYGGSQDRNTFSPITITTTHQLIRFHEAFDVMIIDEVDAFPYSAEAILQFAAEKARKPNSTLIFLTATPSAEWQKECTNGKRNHIILPARFHRHPLPIPRFIWTGNWRKAFSKNKIPIPIRNWFIHRLEIGKQAFIFFPHIELMEQALPLFQQYDGKIMAVHAEDPDRKEKVQAMRTGEIPILLTTTILERGVTIPNIDVAVVGAEDDTFTESALVQISGRVGRNPKYPTGDIAFFHQGKTKAMVRARNQLLRMNTAAKKQGLIY
ncbi:DEAD/DEAH box helicase [Bacillus kwashiorkori]|uniref:DEAD/DEAH box helicase n=1 Tax=Bacillus kwashiorkori TaxID=1522318 RepID=UPI000B330F58|nr:DEAD/DEAH box helicase [Bacillus kwashiorkori]